MTDTYDPHKFSDDETPDDTPCFEVRDLPDAATPADASVTTATPGSTAATSSTGSAHSEDVITDDDVPAKGLGGFKAERQPPTHTQSTRREIALLVVIPTVLFYGYVLVALVYHWVDRDDLTALVAAISPFQALAAAVVGFYFAKKDNDRR